MVNMLIDLDLARKPVVVVGGGKEAELKAVKLSDAGASTTVIAPRFTKGLTELSRRGGMNLVKSDPKGYTALIQKMNPVVLFVSTGQPYLDEKLAKLGRSIGSLVCVVDTPRLNDFNVPAVAKIGVLRIAIATGGRSPAVAKILRKRIEKMIRPEDLLQVELQESLRAHIARSFQSRGERKRMVYEIIRDERIVRLLGEDDLRGAKARAKSMIRERAWLKRRA